MRSRTVALSVTLALALLAAPVPSPGQQPAKVYRIGYLGTYGYAPTDTNPHQCPIKGNPWWQAFLEGLREHGYIQGQNLVIECRWTEAREERASSFAADLVSLKVDLLVAMHTWEVRAAKQATSTIPIVMTDVTNPVENGLVPSLAHPGGNVPRSFLPRFGRPLAGPSRPAPASSRGPFQTSYPVEKLVL